MTPEQRERERRRRMNRARREYERQHLIEREQSWFRLFRRSLVIKHPIIANEVKEWWVKKQSLTTERHNEAEKRWAESHWVYMTPEERHQYLVINGNRGLGVVECQSPIERRTLQFYYDTVPMYTVNLELLGRGEGNDE